MKLNRTFIYCLFILLIPFFSMKANAQFRKKEKVVLVFDSGLESSTIKVTTFKFYVGKFQFFKEDKLVHQDEEYHLIQPGRGNSMAQIQIKKGLQYDSIAMQIGVDSTTNVAGILDGDLDPSKGMYWSWQSGYINVKIEATLENNDKLIYHLGGYLPPHLNQREIGFKSSSKYPKIAVYLGDYLRHIMSAYPQKVMSPGEDAIGLIEGLLPFFQLIEE